MTGPGTGQRLVVVHGPADPVLTSSLIYVGLQVIGQVDDITIWAPLEWPDLSCDGAGRTTGGSILWATPDSRDDTEGYL